LRLVGIQLSLSMHDCVRAILVVDDDPDIREALRDVLEDEGFAVVEAENGKDALDYLAGADPAPCLVLLDLMMPVMDGMQFLAERTGDRRLAEIPVTVVTASRDLTVPRGIPWLPKPISVDAVCRAAHAACDQDQ
jgi:CheY-like chemotaxis protein